MAESEEAKQKSQHELRLSKAFDEAVKLSAPMAGESQRQHTPLSTRSLWSSITTGPVFDAPEPVGRPDIDHDFSSDDEGHVFPHISHPTSATFSLAGLGVVEQEDELDGVPVFGVDDEEEEWNIALPKMALGDVESDRESAGRPDTQHAETQDDDQNATDRFLDAVSLSKVRTTSEEASQTAEYRLTIQGESHLSTNHSLSPLPENSLDEGSLNQSTAGGSSRQERSENVFQNPVMGDREDPPISPLMNIKDEPIDEGYDCALLPSTRNIKEELDNTTPEEELRISSVFSVGGGNSYGSPTGSMAASQNTTSIFGPGRSVVPQGPTMTLRSLAPVPQPQPQAPSSSNPANAVRVSCSGCSKILLRGQTAFQRKGSTQLFCSTVCLTGFTLPPIKLRTCYQCLKEIEDPKDVISVITDNNLKDFCSQFCLSVFNRKRKPGTISMPSFQEPTAPMCSMCKKSDMIQHEVTHQGSLHKLCSDECFMRFRSSHNLVINVCESCGEYCASTDRNCRSLRVEGVTMKFCSRTCISTFKRTTTKVMPCGHCRDLRLMSDMVESTDTDGKVDLFCNSVCVNNSRPQNDLSGTAFPCTYCKVKAVSQYHLAMVDGSIRNFCSYTCVKTFREAEGSQLPPQLGQMNGSSSTAPPMVSPYLQTPPAPPQTYSHPYPPSWVPTTGRPYAPTQTSAPPLPYRAATGLAWAYGVGQHQPGPPMAPSFTSAPSGPVKLSCHQCPQQFRWKPELYEYNGRTMQFCCKLCCVEFKKRSNIKVRCEYCKLEKVVKEVIRYDLIDRPFCSESCKLLFKHDMKGPWRTCAYCADISPKMIHNHFGGRMQEFCRDACMSNYTVLFYEMAKCECCRRQGKMREQLKCFGAIRHFCNLECVIQYCYQTFQLHPRTSNGTTTTQGPSQPLFSLSKPAPVIADVVSLATSPAGQPHATAATALTGALPTSNSHGKSLGDASTQTDAMRISARRRIMKNKAIICKPLMLDQETSCPIPMQTAEKPMAPMGFTETGFTYTENGEKVRVVVMPVPVPVFIPVPMNLYTQYTPVPMGIPVPVPVPIVIPSSLSRSELKDKKDGVASQTMAEQEDEEKDKPVSHGDQGSAYSGDLESEAVSTPHSWGGEDESTSNPQRGAEGPVEPPSTTSSPSMLDLEADYPPESFDRAAVKGQRLTVQATRQKRPKDGFPPRKRSRKQSGTMDMVEQTVSLPPARSKLHHEYGVKAWKNWVLQRNKRFDCEFAKDPSKSMVLKEDVLQCNSSELSYGLCRFISEVRRPNGQAYPADSIFYLCLGIQQYLFENGRIENIFTDVLYHKFTMEITMMLHFWRPTLLPSGYLHSRVEEEYLWDCKQLGAHSPFVLLNTLLFFGTKLFQFKTQSQHRRLSFANFTHCTRVTKNGKSAFLRFRPCQDTAVYPELLALPAKRKLDEQDGDMEMPENTEDPLRCPVRLYEFYISKCSESVRNRPGLFYLQPEPSCLSNSSLWYSGQQLEGAALESMLTRILAVREVHLDEPPLHHHSTEASSASTDDNDDSS